MAEVAKEVNVSDDRVSHHLVAINKEGKENVAVAVTDSVSFGRDWVRKTRFLYAKHVQKLQVGVAVRTKQAGEAVVLALSVGNRCLVIKLPNDELQGCLAEFLSANTNRFVGVREEPPVEFANYHTTTSLGVNLQQLFPVVAWNNFPPTNDQLNQVATESNACFHVALNDHRVALLNRRL